MLVTIVSERSELMIVTHAKVRNLGHYRVESIIIHFSE